jgi:hypothetical protein
LEKKKKAVRIERRMAGGGERAEEENKNSRGLSQTEHTSFPYLASTLKVNVCTVTVDKIHNV